MPLGGVFSSSLGAILLVTGVRFVVRSNKLNNYHPEVTEARDILSHRLKISFGLNIFHLLGEGTSSMLWVTSII